jgi:glycosyltransferase involved in cell wall biosynthesis
VTSVNILTDALRGAGCFCFGITPSATGIGSQDGATWRLPSITSGLADIRLSLFSRRRAISEIERLQPDILHIHTPGPLGLLGAVASGRLGIPLVLTYHTDLVKYAECYRFPRTALSMGMFWYRAVTGRSPSPMSCVSSNRRWLVAEANRLLMADADAVILPTLAPMARTALPVGHRHVAVIPTPAPKVEPQLTRGEFRTRFGIDAQSFVVLFVGRMGPEKNIPLLCAAFRQVLKVKPQAVLLLVGGGTSRQLRALLNQPDLRGRVVLTGPVELALAQAAYTAADVFAFPSLTETQGLVIDEAAAAGLPVVMVDPLLHAHHPAAHSLRLTLPTADAFSNGLLDSAGLERNRDELAKPRQEEHEFASAVLEVYRVAQHARSKRQLSPTGETHSRRGSEKENCRSPHLVAEMQDRKPIGSDV